MMHSSTPVIASDPDGLEGRPALLWLVTITQQSTNQSKVGVNCYTRNPRGSGNYR